jgi:hypothetical protein
VIPADIPRTQAFPVTVREAPARLQRGLALLALLMVLVVGTLSVLVANLNATALRNVQNRKTAKSLAAAKEALIAYATTRASVVTAGYLPLPDLGPAINLEGSAASSMGVTDYSVIGRLPWRTIGISPHRDHAGECLWYAVSGRLKISPKTAALNWDTQGQFDVVDRKGNSIASNVAALLIAPGNANSPQDRTATDPAFPECGGNYDSRDFLDPYDSSNPNVANYFAGSTNGRLASDTSNKQFIAADDDSYNDRFLTVTVDDLYSAIVQRGDFQAQIKSFLDDVDFAENLRTATIAGPKGTDNVDCNAIGNTDNKAFCKNWKEMIFLASLSPPSLITIDGLATTVCNRVLIFSGARTPGQTRVTAIDKANKANYLEGSNLASFGTSAKIYVGRSEFTATDSSADVVRCLAP